MGTKKLSEKLKSLPLGSAASILYLMLFDSDGKQSKATPQMIQSQIFYSQQTNLDAPDRNGIFTLYGCSGTKPAQYGVALSFGIYPGDVYQFAITAQNLMYYRANTNGNINPWYKITGTAISDESVVVPAVGGGKPLFFNTLRNLAERRVA